MITKLLLLALIFTSISGCATSYQTDNQPDYQATIDVLSSRIEELSTQPTEWLSPTPTYTTVPTLTKTPTLISTTEPTTDTSQVIAKNSVVTVEDGGVLVEVERILICDRTWDDIYKEAWLSADIYKEKQTFVEFMFKITNNTEDIIQFNMHTTIASINGEQIYFDDFLYDGVVFGWSGDDLNEKILPGSTVRGFTWTAINKSRWDEVNKIIVSIPHAFNMDYNRVTSEFYIEIDVEEWVFEPIIDH